MGRFFSIFETIISIFVVVSDFLTQEGLRSVGLDRFRGFSGTKKKQQQGAIFDNPLDPQKKERGLLDGREVPSRITGHSLVNNTFGEHGGLEPIVDYTKLSAKNDYKKGLVEEHQKAILSGFGKSDKIIKEKSSTPPLLLRGQRRGAVSKQKAYSYEACDKNLRRNFTPGSEGKVQLGEGGKFSPQQDAGRRKGNGPGGLSHKSVRNFIKF